VVPESWLRQDHALLHGDDGDARRAAVEAWTAAHVDPEWADFSLTTCPEACPWAFVQNALQETAPMGATRVVVVPEAENLLDRAKDLPPSIKSLLQAPLPGTALLLVSRVGLSAAPGKILGAKPMSDWLRAGQVLKVGGLEPAEVLPFLEAEARSKGLTLEREAATLLQERLGTNPGVLRRAMEVLDLVSERRVLSVAVVDALTFRMNDQRAFAWSEAWQRGRLDQALVALQRALEDDPKDAPVALVAQAARDVGRVASLAAALAQGIRAEADLVQTIQLPPNQRFLLGRVYLPVAKKLGLGGAARLLGTVVQADRDVKGCALSPTSALTVLTSELWRAWQG
jgi:DNA polymerase III delta subunit